MKKILYLCPVDWSWIKQRPQFLAEELSEYYQIHAVYPFQNNRKNLQKQSQTNVRLTPCFSLPTLGGRLGFLTAVNRWLNRLQVSRVLRSVRPDCVWVTMPWQKNWLPKDLDLPVIYDCMDDYVAINPFGAEAERLIRQEGEILEKAKVIFASSENLRQVLSRRHQIPQEQIHLLRNGYNANWGAIPAHSGAARLKIGYIGTVGRWFDFDLLLESLDREPELEYHLYGPLEKGTQLPEHSRILYHGVIEHDALCQKTKEVNVLIMPFVVNDIVSSVDPVKLYEYIYMNKNILCVYYPEIARFEPFVMFYKNREAYFDRIKQLKESAQVKYTKAQAEAFLQENSWCQRARQADTVIQTNICTEGKE